MERWYIAEVSWIERVGPPACIPSEKEVRARHAQEHVRNGIGHPGASATAWLQASVPVNQMRSLVGESERRAEAIHQIAPILAGAFLRLRFPASPQNEVDCPETKSDSCVSRLTL
jgi:hypothetical protein